MTQSSLRTRRTLRREKQIPPLQPGKNRRASGRDDNFWLSAGGFEFGNLGEEGLVRGVGFVMIWTFLVSRGYSAADCL